MARGKSLYTDDDLEKYVEEAQEDIQEFTSFMDAWARKMVFYRGFYHREVSGFMLNMMSYQAASLAVGSHLKRSREKREGKE